MAKLQVRGGKLLVCGGKLTIDPNACCDDNLCGCPQGETPPGTINAAIANLDPNNNCAGCLQLADTFALQRIENSCVWRYVFPSPLCESISDLTAQYSNGVWTFSLAGNGITSSSGQSCLPSGLVLSGGFYYGPCVFVSPGLRITLNAAA